MSEMLCYVDQKPTITSPGSHGSMLNQDYQNGYLPASSAVPQVNGINYSSGYNVPTTSSPNSNPVDINQTLIPYGMHASEYGQPTPLNGRIQGNENQQFNAWSPAFNTFGAIPPPFHMDSRPLQWDRQYPSVHPHPFQMQPAPFALPNTTPSPGSGMEDRSPDITGMPYGGQAFFGSSPNNPHQEIDENGQLTSSAPSRRPYEWINKNSYQSLPPPPGKTRTKDKYRVVYTDHQRLELEKEFHFSRYITIRRKAELAGQLCLSERQVKIWFQNRRAKERKINKKKIGSERDEAQNASNDEDASSEDIKSNEMAVSCKSSDDDSLDMSEKNMPSNAETTTNYGTYGRNNVNTQRNIYHCDIMNTRSDSFDADQNLANVYGLGGNCYTAQPIQPSMTPDNQYYHQHQTAESNDNLPNLIPAEAGLTLQPLSNGNIANKSIHQNTFQTDLMNSDNKTITAMTNSPN